MLMEDVLCSCCCLCGNVLMEEVRATALDTVQYSAPSLQTQQADVQSWHGAELQESHCALLKPGTSCVEVRRASASVSNLLSSVSQLEMECTIVPRCCSDEIRPRCSFSFPKKLSHRCVDAIPKVSLPLRYQKAHRFSSKRMCWM